jgi:PleD family two-component response regulator
VGLRSRARDTEAVAATAKGCFAGSLVMRNSSSPPTVMVVDDEPTIADSLSLILNNRGFRSVAVYSAEEAIAALRPSIQKL